MHRLWDILYADPIPVEQTKRECDFIEHFLPLTRARTLLDLACGAGRHSIELAARGYSVTGVDIDPKALEVARVRAARLGVEARFIEHDILDLVGLDESYDGIVLVWQSFGFFTGPSQAALFSGARRILNPDGRLLLDLFNRLHYIRGVEGRTALDELEMLPTTHDLVNPIVSTTGHEDALKLDERRAASLFDSNLTSPSELGAIASSHRFRMLAACSNFDPAIPATADYPRMQLVFEKSSE